jgi:hypothetical protein
MELHPVHQEFGLASHPSIHQSSMVSSQSAKNPLTAFCLEPTFLTRSSQFLDSFCSRVQKVIMNPTAKQSSNWVELAKFSASEAVTIVNLQFLLFLLSWRNFKFVRVLKRTMNS